MNFQVSKNLVATIYQYRTKEGIKNVCIPQKHTADFYMGMNNIANDYESGNILVEVVRFKCKVKIAVPVNE